ncbi:MAG: CDP-diacylglycerol--glycerol-3-phosphate 3-phosphatidyltransferase [Verrucomicrobia bacterium]|nr:CDP-diacylglycerol--glycerol-3-phosphate 3-phosphatidyltransferase [Verrucomicrobiota bacterium]
MNLPNQITLLRLVLVFPFVVALSLESFPAKVIALAIFIVASATDYLDGYLARRLGQITVFGQLLDPLVDKILTLAAFIFLAAAHALPAWAVIIIASREFLITGLRLAASAQGRILAADRLGKQKTTWQTITILFFLGESCFATQGVHLSGWAGVIGTVLLTITLILTIISGAGYLLKNRDVLRET